MSDENEPNESDPKPADSEPITLVGGKGATTLNFPVEDNLGPFVLNTSGRSGLQNSVLNFITDGDFSRYGTYARIFTSEADELKQELAEAKAQAAASQRQLADLQRQIAKNPSDDKITAIESQIVAIAQGVDQTVTRLSQAQARSEELTAPVLVPRREDMGVRLVPIDALDRLEEYRSDGGWLQLFAGLFGGAILGTLINWATNGEEFTPTRFSIVLMIIFAVIAVGLVLWAWRVGQRAERTRRQMLRFAEAQQPPISPKPQPPKTTT